MKNDIWIRSGICLIVILQIIIFVVMTNHPTREDVATICASMIKADSLSFLEKEIILIKESAIYKICEIITGQAEPGELYPHLRKFALWNSIRTNEDNKERRQYEETQQNN